MLSAVFDPAGTPYYVGAITGGNNEATRTAWLRFRAERGLPPGASADDRARRELVGLYMALDGASLPAGTPIVTHGCGESHPTVPTANGVASAENGRVELFFFRGPIQPTPVHPCPPGGCSQYPQWVAESGETFDVRVESEVALTIVDELGEPLSSTQVRIRLTDGTEQIAHTDEHGRVRPKIAPGASYTIVVEDAHEGGVGSALLTASGQHFAAEVSTP